jgi:hypothetical protein
MLQLVECSARCCGFSRELRKTNITKTTHKTKEKLIIQSLNMFVYEVEAIVIFERILHFVDHL